MRRGIVWMLGVALGMGLAAIARAEPDDDATPATEKSGRVWVSPLFSIFKKDPDQTAPEKKTPEKKTPEKKTPETPLKVDAHVANKPTPVESAAAQRKKEEAAFVRRQEVCDKLRAIAVQSNDEALTRKIDQLEAQAWSTYQQRTANLAGNNAGDRLDEGILDRHLGTTAGSTAAQPAGAARGVSSSGRAAAREDMP